MKDRCSGKKQKPREKGWKISKNSFEESRMITGDS